MIAHSVLFAVFALAACGFAAMVVYTSNVVRMTLYLVCSLSATAGLFFLAGAEFVGAMQLMIYVGGTLVLLVFGVMLTAQQRFLRMRPPAGEALLASLVGLSLIVLLWAAAMGVPAWRKGADRPLAADAPGSVNAIALALVGLRPDDPSAAGYLLPFEAVSVHLLVVLVGAAYMARTRSTAQSLVQAPPAGFEDDDLEDPPANPPTGPRP